MAILAIVCNASFAQTIIWEEDWSTAVKDQTPTEVNQKYTFENGGGTTKIYNENLAGGTAPELLVAKSNGSLTASIDLKGASGDMTLRYKTNKTIGVTSATEGVTIGEATKTGNDYELTINVPAGVTTLSLTLTSTTKNNARLDDIKLFQGQAKKAAGLSWGTASREVTIGSEENNFPVLANANNLPVTYTAVPDTAATIDATGAITLIKAGKAVISAIFKGNDEYEAQTVSYTLTVKAAAEEGGEGGEGGETVDISNTPETAYTVAKALELITAGEGLDTKVYVKGTISYIKEISTQYGNATYNLSDDGTTTNELVVYRGNYIDGKEFTTGDELKVGDKVVVYGKLVLYGGNTPEVNSGSSIYSINGTTTGVNSITTDEADANAPVFNLAGQRVNNSFKGVVIQNGKKFINRK